MKWYGFAGSVLHVDLTSRKVTREPLSPGLAEGWIGGLGACVGLAREFLDPTAEPLSEEAAVILGAGPLVGTNLPASSRMYAVARLPQSNTVGWCGGGGVRFAAMLKNAGVDHVVITGRADAPVVLEITDKKARLVDATSLWGKTVGETCQALRPARGAPPGVVAIGPAGENQVRFAMSFVDRFATMGRGGLGAVFGAKNLKAITARGSAGVRVAEPRAYTTLLRDLTKRMRDYPYIEEWQRLGLIKSLPIVPHEVYENLKARRIACVSCPIGDKDVLSLDTRDGELLACSSSAANLFMPMIFGVKDPVEAARCVHLLDELGMDMFEFLTLLGAARDLGEAGVVPASELSPPPALDSPESLREWARKIAGRRGLGDTLAEGAAGIEGRFGAEAAARMPAVVKGMLPYVGPRGPLPWNLFGTMELGQALDPRGPHVGASGSPTYFARRPLEVFPKHLRRMGVPDEAVDRILPGGDELRVGRLLKYSHAWFATLGSLGLCARAQINRFYNHDLCVSLYTATTGIPSTAADFRRRTDRAWSALRQLNMEAGLSPEKDAVPAKWAGEGGFLEYVNGSSMSHEQQQEAVRDYYDEQGWDAETGAPSRQTLERLGLE
ncbi:MAG: aldehyde ferredoxin oxidoreductase N-terminal domain-containing protein [Desulfatibacillaceae bacterium]